MVQFNDLRRLSADMINAGQAGVANKAGRLRNNLAEIQLKNAPQDMAASNRLRDINLTQAERGLQATSPEAMATQQEEQRKAKQQEFMMQYIPKIAQKMADNPELAPDVYASGQKALGQLAVSQGIMTPEEAADIVPLEQFGGVQGFIAAFGNQQQSLEQQKVDLRKTEIEQRERLAQSKAKELNPTEQKILDAAQTSAMNSASSARRMEVLAKEFERVKPTAGAVASFSESLKQLTGDEDAISLLRKEYLQIRASEVINNLPPGVASDKDIEMALRPFPSETANPQVISSFLRGLSKIRKLNSDFNEYKAELISEQGSTKNLIKGWKERQKMAPSIDTEETQPANSFTSSSGIQFTVE